MDIKSIENSIIEKLKTEFSEVPVEGFPDKPSEFILLHPVGTILVHYQGSNYSGSNSISCISQENTKEFSVTVITRDLRSNSGSYEFLERVKKVLTGFRPDGCNSIKPTKDFFISEENGVWQYAINFSLTTTNIENIL